MDPSTEQLIRDYLNRVAAAARRSMGPDEVRAFLARLRESIERQCTAHDVASPADVSSVLAALGGPEALVGLEHARLAAAGSGPRRGGPEPGAATDPMAAAGGSRRRGTRSGPRPPTPTPTLTLAARPRRAADGCCGCPAGPGSSAGSALAARLPPTSLARARAPNGNQPMRTRRSCAARSPPAGGQGRSCPTSPRRPCGCAGRRAGTARCCSRSSGTGPPGRNRRPGVGCVRLESRMMPGSPDMR